MHSTLRTAGVGGLCWLAVRGLASCSTTATQQDDFLPIITNSWHEAGNTAHTFQLNSTDDGKATGAFDGTENPGNSPLNGTWVHSQVQMVIHRAAGNLTESGRFTHQDTLRLASPQGAVLIIVRG